MDTKESGEAEREDGKRRGEDAEKEEEGGGVRDRRSSKSVFDDGDSRRSPQFDP